MKRGRQATPDARASTSAIIDEGIVYTHADLTANIWINTSDPFNGRDDDGNGYVDDVHGWDFDGNNNSTYDGTQDDHGTHVAGTIGAVGGNGDGVAGVNWNVDDDPRRSSSGRAAAPRPTRSRRSTTSPT